ncbi:transcriptional regulator with XRE-family HTH domain/tetratricopeptide (TPR) repeat protein [Actinoplanes lutulentus]|uniref:AAA domain-containing protein n=1 Tax=Actinoplanes lutulentus TaxID=1287878 RepID=A0A327ZLD4_9ACTN|nr:helix-turn-helix domain-containing protein [Actinoplanes lutulentus]MBB2940941.1 transcriptional regulator with XRE-family HTH domain/tetratricopeptide (TPR) repeat protein [Actinoplanes lutulentus]RAK43250.1 AAA domain-containing protein [Actinoplanes lutulentus]
MPLGDRLRELRRSAGLTMEQLSESSGVSVRAISDMERGHIRAPQPRTLAALAGALRVTGAEQSRLEEDARALRMHTAGERPRLCEPPRPVADFVGRAAELDLVRQAAILGTPNGPVPVVVVHGQPGIGKTAFAVRVTEMLREQFPDGCLYVDLRGVDEDPPTAGEAATKLLKALDVNPRRIGSTDDERCSQLRATLRDRRCLLVLDNAADEAQVRPLLPGAGAGLVVVTSRRLLGGLEGVLRTALAPLDLAESAALLRAIAGQAGDPASAGDVDAVSRLCGHLPLALRIAGTRLANRPGWTVGSLVARLADADRRLANLHTGDTGVAAAFALSHAQLSGEGRALFRRLAHVPGADFAAPLAAVLTGSDPDDASDRLDELVELGLLQHEGSDRYRFHDLIRLFATERLRAEEPAGARAATRTRMVRWLLETTIVAGRWFEPGYGALPDGWTGTVPLATLEEAGGWLQAEAANWLGALRLVTEDHLVVDVAEALHWFSDTMVTWPGWYEVYGRSRDAAARLPDRRLAAVHLNYFSWAATACVRRLDEGLRAALDARRLAVEIGDIKEEAWALQYAAMAWRFSDRLEEALEAYRQAQRLADRVGDHDGYIQLFQGIGLTLLALGRHAEALAEFRSTLREVAVRPVSPRPAMNATLVARTSAAQAFVEMGRWEEAIVEAERAMPLAVAYGEPGALGHVHLALGMARAGLGRAAEARGELNRALELFESVAHEHVTGKVRSALASLTR